MVYEYCITALRRKESWWSGAENTTVTTDSRPQATDLLGGKYPGGWLPLLGEEAAED